MDAADLGAVHLFARARRAGLCVERTQLGVGLLEGIVVDAGAGAHAAVVATARGTASVAGRSGPFCPGTRWRRLIVVLQAGDVGAAVAPELRPERRPPGPARRSGCRGRGRPAA